MKAVQRSPTLVQLQVDDGAERVVVDLFADPQPALAAPLVIAWDGLEIRAATAHELLVNKLCALLGRSELRDLRDVEVLLRGGADLERAVRAAPREDAGFSPLTLAWVLNDLPVLRLGPFAGISAEQTAALDTFREALADRLVALAAPDPSRGTEG